MSNDADRIKAILEARENFQRMRAAAFDANQILDRIEGARRQVSNTDMEMRDIITSTRERVAWLIAELDRLALKLGGLA